MIMAKRKKWKPLKRVKNAVKKKKIRKFIGNSASRIIKNRTGIDLGKVKSKSKGNSVVQTVNSVISQMNSLASTPEKAKQNAEQIKSLQSQVAKMNVPLWSKIKTWFIAKWYTAKGIVIGLIVGFLLVLGLSFGVIPMPKKRGW